MSNCGSSITKMQPKYAFYILTCEQVKLQLNKVDYLNSDKMCNEISLFKIKDDPTLTLCDLIF